MGYGPHWALRFGLVALLHGLSITRLKPSNDVIRHPCASPNRQIETAWKRRVVSKKRINGGAAETHHLAEFAKTNGIRRIAAIALIAIMRKILEHESTTSAAEENGKIQRPTTQSN